MCRTGGGSTNQPTIRSDLMCCECVECKVVFVVVGVLNRVCVAGVWWVVVVVVVVDVEYPRECVCLCAHSRPDK